MPASEACLDLKKKGNAAIGKKEFEAAIEAYSLALKEECGEERHKILTNRANARLKLSNKFKTKSNWTKYIATLNQVMDDAIESNIACDGSWWKAYQCIGLVKSRMFAIEEATKAFERAIELVKDMDDSKKTQQYVKLLKKNMADMKSKKEVIVRYVSDLSKVLVLPENDLASLPRLEYFDYVFGLLCKIDGCREKWPKGSERKIVRELNSMIRIYNTTDGKKFLSKDMVKQTEVLRGLAKEQKIPSMKLLIEDPQFGFPVDMRPQGFPGGPQ